MDRLHRPGEHRDGASGGGEAACIARAHPKWDERPLLVVVKKPGAEVTREELLLLRRQDRQVVDARRRGVRGRDSAGATGKVLKNMLRTQFQEHLIAAN